jgi:hypothetical protein
LGFVCFRQSSPNPQSAIKSEINNLKSEMAQPPY